MDGDGWSIGVAGAGHRSEWSSRASAKISLVGGFPLDSLA